MQGAPDQDLVPIDPEIERTFRYRQREARVVQQMANEQNRLGIPLNKGLAVEEDGNTILGDFMAPLVVQSQSSIVYPPFGQPNFQLKINVIQLFQNGHQYHGMASENPHTHISRFLVMCQHFGYQGISDDAIRLRLFSHTLRDKALE